MEDKAKKLWSGHPLREGVHGLAGIYTKDESLNNMGSGEQHSLAYISQYRDINGRRVTKSFSSRKFGEEKAFNEAISFRLNGLHKYHEDSLKLLRIELKKERGDLAPRVGLY